MKDIEIKGRTVPNHFALTLSPKAAFIVFQVVGELISHPNDIGYLEVLSDEELDTLRMLHGALEGNPDGDPTAESR